MTMYAGLLNRYRHGGCFHQQLNSAVDSHAVSWTLCDWIALCGSIHGEATETLSSLLVLSANGNLMSMISVLVTW